MRWIVYFFGAKKPWFHDTLEYYNRMNRTGALTDAQKSVWNLFN